MTNHLQPAPTRWRVEHRLAGWQIVSPRGVAVCSTPTQCSGIELATMFAGVDELLARVARLERHIFGQHPALQASARPYGLSLAWPALSVVEDGSTAVPEGGGYR